METLTHIRFGNPSDLDLLIKLNSQSFIKNAAYDTHFLPDWTYSPSARKYFRELLSDPRQCCLVAEIDEQPAGYLGGSIGGEGYRTGPIGKLDNLGILPEYQRRGIGKLLLTEFKKWCSQRNLPRIIVNSYCENTAALNFYRKHGFHPIDITLELELRP